MEAFIDITFEDDQGLVVLHSLRDGFVSIDAMGPPADNCPGAPRRCNARFVMSVIDAIEYILGRFTRYHARLALDTFSQFVDGVEFGDV